MIQQFRNVAFDQRLEKIGVTTSTGFKIFEAARKIILYEATFQNGGANMIALLSDSNLVAVSGDNNGDHNSTNSIFLWDCDTDTIIRSFDFESPVNKIIFSANCLVACHGQLTTFYNTCDFLKYDEIPNGTGNSKLITLVQSLAAATITTPSFDNMSLNIVDFRDPRYVLGSIPINLSTVSMCQFDHDAELLIIAKNSTKIVELYSARSLRFLASYKTGVYGNEIADISFDRNSGYFMVSTKKGQILVFNVPTPGSRRIIDGAKPAYTLKSSPLITCQFDIAGCMGIGITTNGTVIQFRIDVETQCMSLVGSEIQLDL